VPLTVLLLSSPDSPMLSKIEDMLNVLNEVGSTTAVKDCVRSLHPVV